MFLEEDGKWWFLSWVEKYQVDCYTDGITNEDFAKCGFPSPSRQPDKIWNCSETIVISWWQEKGELFGIKEYSDPVMGLDSVYWYRVPFVDFLEYGDELACLGFV